jgi:hypothetical protein
MKEEYKIAFVIVAMTIAVFTAEILVLELLARL